jgi:chromosome partitioning protein
MAHIIGIVSQKGGVGKSTIARLLAREFADHGWSVKIADMDAYQGTSFYWTQRRAANHLLPEIRTEAFATVRAAVHDAEHFDLFIFDGAPHATSTTREIALASDLVLLPSGLAVDDLQPQVLLAHELVKHGTVSSKIAFVLWRVGDSEAEMQDARQYIEQAGHRVLDGAVPDRTGYRRASDLGRAVTETAYESLNSKADQVAQSIINAVTETITQRRTHGQARKAPQTVTER